MQHPLSLGPGFYPPQQPRPPPPPRPAPSVFVSAAEARRRRRARGPEAGPTAPAHPPPAADIEMGFPTYTAESLEELLSSGRRQHNYSEPRERAQAQAQARARAQSPPGGAEVFSSLEYVLGQFKPPQPNQPNRWLDLFWPPQPEPARGFHRRKKERKERWPSDSQIRPFFDAPITGLEEFGPMIQSPQQKRVPEVLRRRKQRREEESAGEAESKRAPSDRSWGGRASAGQSRSRIGIGGRALDRRSGLGRRSRKKERKVTGLEEFGEIVWPTQQRQRVPKALRHREQRKEGKRSSAAAAATAATAAAAELEFKPVPSTAGPPPHQARTRRREPERRVDVDALAREVLAPVLGQSGPSGAAALTQPAISKFLRLARRNGLAGAQAMQALQRFRARVARDDSGAAAAAAPEERDDWQFQRAGVAACDFPLCGGGGNSCYSLTGGRCRHWFCGEHLAGVIKARADGYRGMSRRGHAAALTCGGDDAKKAWTCSHGVDVKTVGVAVAFGLVDERFLRLYRSLKEREDLAKKGLEMVQCPYPECKFAGNTREFDSKLQRVACRSCRKKFCASCASPWHGKKSCAEYQNEKKGIDLATKRILVRCYPCPGCGIRVEKTGGCNHMSHRCTSIAARNNPANMMHWCYCCGATLNPADLSRDMDGRRHFPDGSSRECLDSVNARRKRERELSGLPPQRVDVWTLSTETKTTVAAPLPADPFGVNAYPDPFDTFEFMPEEKDINVFPAPGSIVEDDDPFDEPWPIEERHRQPTSATDLSWGDDIFTEALNENRRLNGAMGSHLNTSKRTPPRGRRPHNTMRRLAERAPNRASGNDNVFYF